MKEALLSWRGSFVGKKRKMVWKSIPLYIFWTVWKKRNHKAFREGSLAVQRSKHSFVTNMWSLNSLYISEEVSLLIVFWSGWLMLRVVVSFFFAFLASLFFGYLYTS